MNKGSALVIGGTGEIGNAILIGLRRRRLEALAATSQSGKARSKLAGVQWIPFRAGAESPQSTFGDSIAALPSPLRAVFYCVGTNSTKRLVTDTPDEEWTRLVLTNCVGFVHVYTAIQTLCRTGRTRVVALGSDATRTMRARNAAYTASKVALEAVCTTLAKEESRHGVRINVLAPSAIDSPLADTVMRLKGVRDKRAYVRKQPWGRLLTAREVADAAISVAFDDAWSYASGQVIRIAAQRSSDG